MEINIRKAEVYKEVEKMTAIIGASIVAENGYIAYNAIWANEYDAEVLDTWWRDGVSMVTSMMIKYIGSQTVEHRLYGEGLEEVFSLSARMPTRFDENLVGGIIEEIKMMLACMVTSGWLGVKLPDRKKDFDERAISLAADVQTKLLYRKPYERKPFEEKKEEIIFRRMKNVKVVLHKEEIVADVSASAHLVGQRLKGSDNLEQVAEIQVPEEGISGEVVSRAMSTALSRLKTCCARYVASGFTMNTNAIESLEGDWELLLLMPESWNFAVMEELTLNMHNSVVDYCLFSIFEKLLPTEASSYLGKSEAEFGEIKRLLELRTEPVKRRCRLY